MEDLLVYLQTPEVLAPVLGVCAIALVFAIIKKAVKLCTFLVILGVAVAAVRPVATQAMINNGVSFEGTVLTIATEQETYNIDLAMGAEFSSEKTEDGGYIITVDIPEVGEKTVEVSQKTAAWVNFAVKIMIELEKTGEDVVLKDWRI